MYPGRVHDHALDIKNFHLGSHNAQIVPVLVATNAKIAPTEIDFSAESVAIPLLLGSANIVHTLSMAPGPTQGNVLDFDG